MVDAQKADALLLLEGKGDCTRPEQRGHVPFRMHKIDDGGRCRDASDVSGAQLEGRSIKASLIRRVAPLFSPFLMKQTTTPVDGLVAIKKIKDCR